VSVRRESSTAGRPGRGSPYGNDATRSVADATRTPPPDAVRLISKSLEFSRDAALFNVKGAREAGTRLADFILRRELIPDVG